MRRIVLLVTTMLGACTQASPPERPEEGDTKAETKQDPVVPSAWTEAKRTHLLLAKHTPEAKAARYLPIELDTRKPGAATDVDAVPLPNWPGHFASVAAHGGRTKWVVVRPSGGGVEMVVNDPGSPTVAHALPNPAAAMHMVGDAVFLGIETSVHRIDLHATEAELELLVARAGAGGKAYDVFVRRQDWLLAIDDVVRPIYADAFRLQPDGSAAHDAAFDMPGLINGTYSAGVLDPSGADTGTLYMIASYGIMDGSGQDLVALPIVGGKTKHDGELVLNSTVSTDPPVLEEHVDRGTNKPVKIIAGTEVTQWTGIELVGEGDARRLLLPAGARGLLAVPLPFTPETKAEVVFAEPVNDVEVDGTRVFVLTGKQLVELAWTITKPTEVARVELGDTYHRIVD